mmetsp:Transcript_113723/g.328388  ORF Transcript_113723/g.328388 Transcript_113723/m.328388 type:complete len:260 (-) Transcript_113723:102-881(-)
MQNHHGLQRPRTCRCVLQTLNSYRRRRGSPGLGVTTWPAFATRGSSTCSGAAPSASQKPLGNRSSHSPQQRSRRRWVPPPRTDRRGPSTRRCSGSTATRGFPAEVRRDPDRSRCQHLAPTSSAAPTHSNERAARDNANQQQTLSLWPRYRKERSPRHSAATTAFAARGPLVPLCERPRRERPNRRPRRRRPTPSRWRPGRCVASPADIPKAPCRTPTSRSLCHAQAHREDRISRQHLLQVDSAATHQPSGPPRPRRQSA